MSDPELLILSSLADGDKHGYAMMLDIEVVRWDVKLGLAHYMERSRGSRNGVGFHQRLPVTGVKRPAPSRLAAGRRQILAEDLARMERIAKTGLRRLKNA